jgi:hypothetical protein
MLELKLNGEDITSDEYLENALKLIPGTGGLGWEGWGGRAGVGRLGREGWGGQAGEVGLGWEDWGGGPGIGRVGQGVIC